VYADTLKIFYDPLGGDRLGAVWEPSVRQPRPFRVLNHFSSAPMTQQVGFKGWFLSDPMVLTVAFS